MEPRFERRKEQLLAGCQVPPTLFRGVMSRLEDFARPFAAALPSPESRAHTRTYLAGLLSDVERKNAESIAYRYDLDRQVIQRFIGEVDWDHDPLIAELTRHLARAIGRPDAVLVFDPSAFPKKGTASVGVKRQWCGRLGKVENCQVGVFLGYVTDCEHALVDFRLYLPREWARDRKRRKKAGVPKDVRYRTRHELALEMLARGAGAAARLGRRRRRDGPAGVVPPPAGRGRAALLPGGAVEHHGPRPGGGAARVRRSRPPSQGPLPRGARLVRGAAGGGVDQAHRAGRREGPAGGRGRRPAGGVEGGPAGRRVRGDAGGRPVHRRRCPQAGLPPLQRPAQTPLSEFARVAKASHRIEECLKRSKGEAGLGEYQVRNWRGWHHHMALSLIATWFLVVESRRGKKGGPGVDGAAGADGVGVDPAPRQRVRHAVACGAGADAPAGAERVGAILSLQGT